MSEYLSVTELSATLEGHKSSHGDVRTPAQTYYCSSYEHDVIVSECDEGFSTRIGVAARKNSDGEDVSTASSFTTPAQRSGSSYTGHTIATSREDIHRSGGGSLRIPEALYESMGSTESHMGLLSQSSQQCSETVDDGVAVAALREGQDRSEGERSLFPSAWMKAAGAEAQSTFPYHPPASLLQRRRMTLPPILAANIRTLSSFTSSATVGSVSHQNSNAKDETAASDDSTPGSCRHYDIIGDSLLAKAPASIAKGGASFTTTWSSESPTSFSNYGARPVKRASASVTESGGTVCRSTSSNTQTLTQDAFNFALTKQESFRSTLSTIDNTQYDSVGMSVGVEGGVSGGAIAEASLVAERSSVPREAEKSEVSVGSAIFSRGFSPVSWNDAVQTQSPLLRVGRRDRSCHDSPSVFPQFPTSTTTTAAETAASMGRGGGPSQNVGGVGGGSGSAGQPPGSGTRCSPFYSGNHSGIYERVPLQPHVLEQPLQVRTSSLSNANNVSSSWLSSRPPGGQTTSPLVSLALEESMNNWSTNAWGVDRGALQDPLIRTQSFVTTPPLDEVSHAAHGDRLCDGPTSANNRTLTCWSTQLTATRRGEKMLAASVVNVDVMADEPVSSVVDRFSSIQVMRSSADGTCGSAQRSESTTRTPQGSLLHSVETEVSSSIRAGAVKVCSDDRKSIGGSTPPQPPNSMTLPRRQLFRDDSDDEVACFMQRKALSPARKSSSHRQQRQHPHSHRSSIDKKREKQRKGCFSPLRGATQDENIPEPVCAPSSPLIITTTSCKEDRKHPVRSLDADLFVPKAFNSSGKHHRRLERKRKQRSTVAAAAAVLLTAEDAAREPFLSRNNASRELFYASSASSSDPHRTSHSRTGGEPQDEEASVHRKDGGGSFGASECCDVRKGLRPQLDTWYPDDDDVDYVEEGEEFEQDTCSDLSCESSMIDYEAFRTPLSPCACDTAPHFDIVARVSAAGPASTTSPCPSAYPSSVTSRLREKFRESVASHSNTHAQHSAAGGALSTAAVSTTTTTSAARAIAADGQGGGGVRGKGDAMAVARVHASGCVSRDMTPPFSTSSSAAWNLAPMMTGGATTRASISIGSNSGLFIQCVSPVPLFSMSFASQSAVHANSQPRRRSTSEDASNGVWGSKVLCGVSPLVSQTASMTSRPPHVPMATSVVAAPPSSSGVPATRRQFVTSVLSQFSITDRPGMQLSFIESAAPQAAVECSSSSPTIQLPRSQGGELGDSDFPPVPPISEVLAQASVSSHLLSSSEHWLATVEPAESTAPAAISASARHTGSAEQNLCGGKGALGLLPLSSRCLPVGCTATAGPHIPTPSLMVSLHHGAGIKEGTHTSLSVRPAANVTPQPSSVDSRRELLSVLLPPPSLIMLGGITQTSSESGDYNTNDSSHGAGAGEKKATFVPTAGERAHAAALSQGPFQSTSTSIPVTSPPLFDLVTLGDDSIPLSLSYGAASPAPDHKQSKQEVMSQEDKHQRECGTCREKNTNATVSSPHREQTQRELDITTTARAGASIDKLLPPPPPPHPLPSNAPCMQSLFPVSADVLADTTETLSAVLVNAAASMNTISSTWDAYCSSHGGGAHQQQERRSAVAGRLFSPCGASSNNGGGGGSRRAEESVRYVLKPSCAFANLRGCRSHQEDNVVILPEVKVSLLATQNETVTPSVDVGVTVATPTLHGSTSNSCGTAVTSRKLFGAKPHSSSSPSSCVSPSEGDVPTRCSSTSSSSNCNPTSSHGFQCDTFDVKRAVNTRGVEDGHQKNIFGTDDDDSDDGKVPSRIVTVLGQSEEDGNKQNESQRSQGVLPLATERLFCCFGVFDGHNGEEVSQRAAQYYCEHFQNAYQQHYALQVEKQSKKNQKVSPQAPPRFQGRKQIPQEWQEDEAEEAENPLPLVSETSSHDSSTAYCSDTGRGVGAKSEEKIEATEEASIAEPLEGLEGDCEDDCDHRILSAALVQSLLHLDVTLYDTLNGTSTGAGSTACVAACYLPPQRLLHDSSRGVCFISAVDFAQTHSWASGAPQSYSSATSSTAHALQASRRQPKSQDSVSWHSPASCGLAQGTPPGHDAIACLPHLEGAGKIEADRAEQEYEDDIPGIGAEGMDYLRISIANLGDSRAVLGRVETGEVLLETKDHRVAASMAERERILLSGGVIDFDRVDGSLDVTRGLGDYRFKQPPSTWWAQPRMPPLKRNIISNIADAYEWRVRDGDFLVLATDGVWDRISSADVALFVSEELQGRNGALRVHSKKDDASVVATLPTPSKGAAAPTEEAKLDASKQEASVVVVVENTEHNFDHQIDCTEQPSANMERENSHIPTIPAVSSFVTAAAAAEAPAKAIAADGTMTFSSLTPYAIEVRSVGLHSTNGETPPPSASSPSRVITVPFTNIPVSIAVDPVIIEGTHTIDRSAVGDVPQARSDPSCCSSPLTSFHPVIAVDRDNAEGTTLEHNDSTYAASCLIPSVLPEAMWPLSSSPSLLAMDDHACQERVSPLPPKASNDRTTALVSSPNLSLQRRHGYAEGLVEEDVELLPCACMSSTSASVSGYAAYALCSGTAEGRCSGVSLDGLNTHGVAYTYEGPDSISQQTISATARVDVASLPWTAEISATQKQRLGCSATKEAPSIPTLAASLQMCTPPQWPTPAVFCEDKGPPSPTIFLSAPLATTPATATPNRALVLEGVARGVDRDGIHGIPPNRAVALSDTAALQPFLTRGDDDHVGTPRFYSLQRTVDRLAEHVLHTLNSNDNVTIVLVLFSQGRVCSASWGDASTEGAAIGLRTPGTVTAI